MKCPHCRKLADERVVDSRENSLGTYIRRRRECLNCGHRFTTIETIDGTVATVSSKSGQVVIRDATRLPGKGDRWKRG